MKNRFPMFFSKNCAGHYNFTVFRTSENICTLIWTTLPTKKTVCYAPFCHHQLQGDITFKTGPKIFPFGLKAHYDEEVFAVIQKLRIAMKSPLNIFQDTDAVRSKFIIYAYIDNFYTSSIVKIVGKMAPGEYILRQKSCKSKKISVIQKKTIHDSDWTFSLPLGDMNEIFHRYISNYF